MSHAPTFPESIWLAERRAGGGLPTGMVSNEWDSGEGCVGDVEYVKREALEAIVVKLTKERDAAIAERDRLQQALTNMTYSNNSYREQCEAWRSAAGVGGTSGIKMSKKIWRGYQIRNHRKEVHDGNEAYNCTVIPDATCFPVREAMALIKQIGIAYNQERDDEYALAACVRNRAISKYAKAVQRMQKKAGKK